MRLPQRGQYGLRLFYGSRRYSEDLDLDGDPASRLAIRSKIRGIFNDRAFTRSLQEFGLRGLDPKEGPNKDTETTFRYKFHVLAGGGEFYGTKVEVSFRGRNEADGSRKARPDTEVVGDYVGREHGLQVQRYERNASVRQKIEALAGRTRVEARDIFDIHVLLRGSEGSRPELHRFLAETVTAKALEIALERALTLDYPEYEALVVRFLADEVRDAYKSPGRWDEVRLQTSRLLEGVMAKQENPG